MSRPASFLERHFRPVQLGLAILVSAVVVGVGEFGVGRAAVEGALAGNRGALYGAIAQIAGSLTGFTITALTVVIGFVERPQFVVIRQSRQYWPTMRIFFDATAAEAALCVTALIALFTDTDSNPRIALSYLVLLLVAIAAVTMWRCLWALEKIVRAGALARPQGA